MLQERPVAQGPADFFAAFSHGRARFLLSCTVYWASALLVVSAVPAVERLGIQVTLGSVHALLWSFRQNVTISGDVISLARTQMVIVSDCSPHLPFLLYTGVLLAFPAGWRKRAVGIVLGAALITLFNAIRVVALIGTLIAWPRAFDFTHTYLWQTGTLLVVLGTFLLWIKLASGHSARKRVES